MDDYLNMYMEQMTKALERMAAAQERIADVAEAEKKKPALRVEINGQVERDFDGNIIIHNELDSRRLP